MKKALRFYWTHMAYENHILINVHILFAANMFASIRFLFDIFLAGSMGGLG